MCCFEKLQLITINLILIICTGMENAHADKESLHVSVEYDYDAMDKFIRIMNIENLEKAGLWIVMKTEKSLAY